MPIQSLEQLAELPQLTVPVEAPAVVPDEVQAASPGTRRGPLLPSPVVLKSRKND